MNTQAYTIAAMIGRYILIGLCFLVFIQAILEIRKAAQASRYKNSENPASIKWLRKRIIFALDSENIIGRANNCDVVIKSAYLKRKHFKLYLDCDEWIIEPFKNCELYINKVLTEEKTAICHKDKIKVGRENFVFLIETDEEEPEEIDD